MSTTHPSTMMNVSKDSIKQFIADNANVYPYSEVKCTRNGYHCKWSILQARGRNVDALCVNQSYLYAMPTACIGSGSLQELLLSKVAIPLTGAMEDIYDCMSIWGRGISERWHQLVLTLMCSELKRRHKQLCQLCIQIRANDLIKDRLSMQPVLACQVLLRWHIAYDNIYDYITKEFFELCMRSFHFVVVKINEALSSGLTPMTTESEDDSDSDVVCVPVVSSSSDV